MPEIDTTVEFEAWCAKCGAGMCGNFSDRRSGYGGSKGFDIEPCEACLQERYDEGFQDGADEVNSN